MSRGTWLKKRDERLIALVCELSGESPEVVNKVIDELARAILIRALETGGTTTIPRIGDLKIDLKHIWSNLTKRDEISVTPELVLTSKFKEEFKRIMANNPSLTSEELTAELRDQIKLVVSK